MNFEEIKNKLKKYNQEHLMIMYEKLSVNEKEILLNQIENIDFELMKKLYILTQKEEKKDLGEIKPIKYIDKNEIKQEKKNQYYKIGGKIISENKFAVVTMAGGQGTRLRTQWTKRNIYVRSKSR